jgi:DNA-binding NarL/FixJ family response regulator
MVVGEAENVDSAVEVVKLELPHLVIIEAHEGNVDSIRAIPKLLSVCGQVKVLVISSSSDALTRHLAVQNGALGVVSKQSVPAVFFSAVEKINNGEAWIDRSTMARVLTEMLRPEGAEGQEFKHDNMDSLTQREKEVASSVARGLSNKQIGIALSISEITVRHHLTSIFAKLKVSDRYELTLYAIKNSILL